VIDGQYVDLVGVARRGRGVIDHDALTELLMQSVAEDHGRTAGPGPLVAVA
jgi:hypothetical protein